MRTSLREDAVLVTELSSGGVRLSGGLAAPVMPLQEKTATPAELRQTVFPDPGCALSAVTVEPIPSNYGKITWNGVTLTVS